MFRNYLKIALRNLHKHKLYTLINVSGLTIGMACCFLILLFVRYELSFDQFHKNSDQIYRIYTSFYYQNDPPLNYVTTFPAAGPEITKAFPEILQFVRFYRANAVVSYGKKRFDEDRFFFADSTLWKVFAFPLVNGDPKSALSKPYTVVITEETAEKYFGTEDPIGRQLALDDTVNLTVTGVLQNLPSNSHLKFDFLTSFATFEHLHGIFSQWGWDNFYTYFLLKPGTSHSELEAKFPSLIDKHFPDVMRKVLQLQSIKDIHLRSHYNNELEANSSLANVYIFTTIALFILLIACINFMNLATTRAIDRTREVGMRKVVGARRSQLIIQFLGEAILVSFASVLIAGALVESLLPVFSAFIGVELTLSLSNLLLIIPSVIAVALLVGILSGSYPAFFLSSFKPIDTLKGDLKKGFRGNALRKGLVVFQFVISVILIISTRIVTDQLSYMRNQNLGFVKEQVMVIPFGNSEVIKQQRGILKSQVLQNSMVLNASITSRVPGQRIGVLSTKVTTDDKRNLPILIIDPDFVDTYKIQLASGRNFSKEIPADATGYLVNETLVKELGWGSLEDAIGKALVVAGDEGRIIGVVKDFHFKSLQHSISPIIFSMQRDWHRYLTVRIATTDIGYTIDFLKKTWQKIDPGHSFAYFFLDEFYNRQYLAEEKLKQIISAFAVLANIIACLGLFGLASFTSEQRTKEIGIRKVLGATVMSVLSLLSKDFVKLVLLANLISWPVVWYIMNRWLEDFAYRTSINWWIFVLTGGLALVIAILTVSYQAIKAALANPVDALRYE